MPVYEILPDLWSVGAVDWDIRSFHGPSFSTHRGTTYNAFLLKDEKVALVDTVARPFSGELVDNIKLVAGPQKLDYIIVNHIEPDHSGAFPVIMGLNPSATVVCTAKAREGLHQYYGGDWNFHIVKTGDSIRLGKHTMHFVETPMLHWPDNMVTYIPEQQVLLSNDAFGQHLAWSQPFDDQNDLSIIMAEATKYYANILTPFRKIAAKKLEEIAKMGLDIQVIAPAHGVIWRSHAKEILEAYGRWSASGGKARVLIVYDTMWGSTEKMARAVLAGIADKGIPVQLYKASASDHNDIIADLLESRALIAGSSTINNDLLNPVSSLLAEVRALKFSGRLGAAFGSYGWRSGAVEKIEQYLTEAGLDLAQESIRVQGAPGADALAECRRWGTQFAEKLQD